MSLTYKPNWEEAAMMTPRARILAAMRHTGPDRIPWAPYIGWEHYQTLGGWDEARRREEDGADRFATLRFILDYHASVGADFVSWGYPGAYVLNQPSVKVSRHSDGPFTHERYETPLGTLTSETGMTAGPDGANYPYTRKHLIESPEDMRIYAYMTENTEVRENDVCCRDWLSEVGEAGVELSMCPSAPLKSLILVPMSVEGVVFAIQDHRRAFDQLVAAMHKTNLEIYRICGRSPVTVFMDWAVSGTSMISPRIYRDYAVAYSRAYADILHERGKIYISLTAGEPFKGILSEIEQCGFDGIWGYQPTREKNASLADIRAAWGDRLFTGGGVFTDLLRRGTRQDVIAMVSGVLDQVRPDDRFILSTSSIVVPGTPTENLSAIGRLVAQSPVTM